MPLGMRSLQNREWNPPDPVRPYPDNPKKKGKRKGKNAVEAPPTRQLPEVLAPKGDKKPAPRTPLPPRPPMVQGAAPTVDRLPKPMAKLDAQAAIALALSMVENDLDDVPEDLVCAIRAALPRRTDLQQEIHDSLALRKVINTGRRVGKTTGGGIEACDRMCAGQRVLLISTTQDQADAFWEKCTEWLQPWIMSGDIKKNETRRILYLKATGGRIKVKTGRDPDVLRGDWCDFLILDECALLDPDAWYKVAAPMLMDRDGEVWFLSTPRFMNWFHELHLQAVEDEEENGAHARWNYFHATSFDNPHLSQAALSEIIKDLDEEGYKQEILALFLEGQGAVFRNIDVNMTSPDEHNPKDHWDHWVVMGGDYARSNDYTAFSVFCATCKMELYRERFRKMEWALQRDRVSNAWRLWNVKHGFMEANGPGQVNNEELRKEQGIGDLLEDFNTERYSKPRLVQRFKLALDREEARWQKDRIWSGELMAYEAVHSQKTGHTAYSAPKRMHDDTVMTRMITWYAATEGRPVADVSSTTFRDIQTGQVAVISDPYDGVASSSYAGQVGYNTAIAPPPGTPWDPSGLGNGFSGSGF